MPAQWGDRLPVWVSFAFWTRLLADPASEQTSLRDLLHAWLRSHEEGRLWPLVENALDDDRLLLLIDGLDEWSNSTAANVAGQRLAVFAKQRNVPVVAVGRPSGVATLSLSAQEWPVGELADFDPSQQRQLATHWFEEWIRHEGDNNEGSAIDVRVRAKVQDLMQELGSPDLAAVAKIPLLLSLLILLKLNNVTLPNDRFKAYDELLKHLITIHPQRRREAAGLTDVPPLEPEDITRVLANLAFVVQHDYSEGIIERVRAIDIVEDYLKQDLGFDIQNARRNSRQLVDTAGASTGLLVARSEKELLFFHRSLQEYLAAQHISRLPLERQLQIIRECGNDARWHEVLLGLLRLTSRPDDAKKYIEELQRLKVNAVERLDVQALLLEAAAGNFNLPPYTMRELLHDGIAAIETGAWLPHRERLLTRLLRGLRTSAAGDIIRRKVSEWYPAHFGVSHCMLQYLNGPTIPPLKAPSGAAFMTRTWQTSVPHLLQSCGAPGVTHYRKETRTCCAVRSELSHPSGACRPQQRVAVV